jgi:hypothetical protein
VSVPHFDHDFVSEIVDRLNTIAPDATPAWGKMKPEDLPTHLAGLLLYSMGRSEPVQDRSNWVQRNVLKRLVLSGIMPIPKNIQIPESMVHNLTPPTRYDVESLHALLDEYLNYVLSGGGDPIPHPFLGPFSTDDWANLHYRHFEHHFKQFGV